MDPIDDGTYDVIVVDAHEDDRGAVHVDLALTTGTRKGEVVQLVARGMERDALSLLGLPGTLHVEAGTPRLVL